MKIKIRPVTSDDIGEVLSLLKDLKISGYQEMGLKDIKVKIAPNASDFYKKIIKRPDILYLLAECNGKICGLCFGYLIPKILEGGHRLVIEEMVVRERFRGKGVGGVLLETIEKKAKKRGLSLIKITSGTKLKANQFYKKHGYIHFENAYRKKL
ncbi:GNAT family N-acetyltransferase [Candidatus Microgenomates bacterium]|nr:GNAT family N-acetyltransferase [Candidatus Microgenomates bacterium]